MEAIYRAAQEEGKKEKEAVLPAKFYRGRLKRKQARHR